MLPLLKTLLVFYQKVNYIEEMSKCYACNLSLEAAGELVHCMGCDHHYCEIDFALHECLESLESYGLN